MKNYSKYEDDKVYPTILSIEIYYLFCETLNILINLNKNEDLWDNRNNIINIFKQYNNYFQNNDNNRINNLKGELCIIINEYIIKKINEYEDIYIKLNIKKRQYDELVKINERDGIDNKEMYI